MRKIAGIALAVACTLAAAYAVAQDHYPSRPIQVVNPYPPGGSVDILLRALVDPLQRLLAQPVVVINRRGAAGAVGIAEVAHATPDGYTVVVASPALSTIPQIDRLLGRTPAYTADQLTGVALFSAEPPLLVVHSALPAKTAREFIELAKAHPGELVVPSGGLYGSAHLPMAMLEAAAGVRFRNLITTGGGPSISAVLSGHAAAFAGPTSVVTPHVQSGRVRVLAHWGVKRLPAFPDVPSFKELGINVEYYFWVAMFAPAQTPPAVLEVLQHAVRQAVQDPEFTAAMAKVNTPIDYRDGAEFHAWYQRDLQRLTEAIRTIATLEETQ